MPRATMSFTGQLDIPKEIRDQLDWKPGTQIVLDIQGDKLVMKRLSAAATGDWRAMRGMFSGSPGNILEDLAAERVAEVARENERLQGS